MLSDRDRLLLAPHLPLLRAAQAELATAQRAYDEAERQATESTTGTDWRDRLLGGLLSVDEGRSRRYRQARGARKAADEALAAARARYTRYAERIDGLLEPMLIRDDPAYQRKVAAVRVCEHAVRAAEEMRFRLSSALAKPAPAARGTKRPSRKGPSYSRIARCTSFPLMASSNSMVSTSIRSRFSGTSLAPGRGSSPSPQ